MKTLTTAFLAAALLTLGAASAPTFVANAQQETTFAAASEGTGHVDLAAAAKPEGNGYIELAGMPPEGYTAPEGTPTA